MREPLLTIGSLQVTPFSVGVFLAALAGGALLLLLAAKKKQPDSVLVLLPLTLCLGILLGHGLFAVTRVLIYPLDYEHPLAFILNPSVGGYMYLGVFAGGAIAAWITGRIHKTGFADQMSLLLPAMLLTLAIVRFAEPLDFQGKGPGVEGGFFPFAFAPEVDYPEDLYVPVFFYEGVYALILAVWSFSNTLSSSRKTRPVKFFFILYLAGQMFFEVFRQDEYINATSLITFIRLNQLFAVILLGGYLVYDVIRARQHLGAKAIWLRCVVFAISVAACVGLQFLFDKPLPLFGQTIWFANWLVYLLLALTAVGMGWAVLSLIKHIPQAEARKA